MSNYEINILVNGKPVSQYFHEGNTFIEGRSGSEFEIEFKNNTPKRVLAVISVDGKSVMDGSRATPDSDGYVVNSYSRIRIPGWRLDAADVAKFVFAAKEASYAAQTAEEGEIINNGVLGIMVYNEKVKPPVYRPRTPWPRTPGSTFPGSWPTTPTPTPEPGYGNGIVWSSAENSPLRSMSMCGTPVGSAATIVGSSAATSDSAPMEMGTEFGSRSEFKTTEVSFEKDTVVKTLLVYYDSLRNLKKRGIDIKEEKIAEALPSAFASTGCTPPKGWE